ISLMPCAADEIHDAAQKGDTVKVKNLLKKNPELLNSKDANGMTPLHFALFTGKKELVDFLIAGGAKVNAADNQGITPLMIAAFFGHKQGAQLLISKGAKLEPAHSNGMTALLFAVSRGRKEVVELLAAKGASLKATDKLGSTPLLLAALNGKKEMIELLIGKGADMNAANSRGSTPLTVAVREGHKEIADLLLAKGAKNTLKKKPVLKGEYLGQPKPGLVPVLFAPGFVSTEHRQLNAVFTADGKEFYFSVSKPNTPFAIMVTKQVNGQWSTPAVIPFGGKHSDVDHSISPDGKRFFFCSRRPVNVDDKPKKDHDFWVAERINKDWSEPRHLGFEVNTDKEDYYPVVTRDGTLYFSSQREGEGTNNIYHSRLKDGKYTKADKLGEAVNTEYREFDPFIAPDESFLIFASERPDGYGASDLYISFRKEDGAWAKAKNMGEGINSSGPDFTPMLSPDGKYLFFTSGRGGVNDIYWVDAKIIKGSK
ncbi:MAG: hypothetical protein GY950_22125, partial [bacterium]|nr:hypothetical protein [bacterium]